MAEEVKTPKTLNTRISLKYDTWENWNKWYSAANPNTTAQTPEDINAVDFSLYANKGAALVLKEGEVAFCAVDNKEQGAQNAPTILFKVGDGTNPFCKLKWASALAADVHEWAKKSQTEFEGYIGDLITAALAGEGVEITGYVTTSNFDQFKTTLENTTIKGINDKIADITNDSETGRLDVIEKDYTTAAQAGTIAQGKVDAVVGDKPEDYTGAAPTMYGLDAAVKAAQLKADENATAISKLDETYATDKELEDAVAGLKATKEAAKPIDETIAGAKAYADARKADLLGSDTDNAGYVAGTEGATLDKKTVEGAINVADAAFTKAKANATEIAGIKTNITDNVATKDELNALKGTKDAEGKYIADADGKETIAGAKAYADAAINTFYNTYIENDTKALDTLKDVTAWLDANKDGAADIVSDITNLQNNKLDKTEFNTFKTSDFKAVADKAHEHANKALLDTYTQTEANLADAVAKKHSHAANMVEVTPAMKEAWDKVSEKATTSDLNAHTTNKDNPHEVTADQVGAYTTAQADAKFAVLTAFESDKTTVKEATHAGSATTADSATKATQDGDGNVITTTYETKTNVAALATRVQTIENDYLKAADEFIIDCGSSTENIF